MKKLIVMICVFFCCPAYAQRANFIGTYQHVINSYYDTAVYLFLSRDSVKEVSSVRIKKGKDVWLRVKCGYWFIKEYLPHNSYTITFKFNDSTTKDVLFAPVYHSPYINDSTRPDSYEPDIAGQNFTKLFGKGSLSEKVAPQVKSFNRGQ